MNILSVPITKRGAIESLVALALFATILLGVGALLLNSTAVQKREMARELAQDVLGKKLEELYNLSFNHADLDPSTNPHMASDLKWEVTTIHPRLKKIYITKIIDIKTDQSITLLGFKFDDF